MSHITLAHLQSLLQKQDYAQAAREGALLLASLTSSDTLASHPASEALVPEALAPAPHPTLTDGVLVVDVLELLGEACEKLGDHAQAARHFLAGAWAGGPKAALLWRRAGFSLSQVGEDFAATQAYYHALALNPADHRAANNLLGVQRRHGRYLAVLELARYLGQQSTWPDFLGRAALLLKDNGKQGEAYRVYQKALTHRPGDMSLVREVFYLALSLSDFDTQAALRPQMLEYLERQPEALHEDPLQNLRWLMDERVNGRVARLAMDRKRVGRRPLFDHQGHVFGPRIRVGYVSADFKQHAVLTAMIGFFEHHDRQRFEVFAYCHSKQDNSELQRRFLACVDHHVRIADMSDQEAAQRIFDDKIDILVDLQGHTTHSRTALFEYLPAPVQMGWMGYPGSSGSEAMHYILSDAASTPDSSKPHYTEKLCRLPETFFTTDNTRARCAQGVTRAAEGLPEDALVFCCFNNAYKFDEQTFALWMDVLRELPHSVLWIREPDNATKLFLYQAMDAREVSRERLIFARRSKGMEQHLARLGLADLGLDTRIYNGHSMTADTLWAGVPVLTLCGGHFASRVAESLLRAVGLEELAAKTPEELRERILRLGRCAQERQALRDKLRHNLTRWPLFDTERHTRHVEEALRTMVQRAAAGLPPDHMDIPALPARTRPFLDSLPLSDSQPEDLSPSDLVHAVDDHPVLRYDFGLCPLCAHRVSAVVHEGPLDVPPAVPADVSHGTRSFPDTARWLQCQRCQHVYATWQYTPEGRARLQALQALPTGQGSGEGAALVDWSAEQSRAACITQEALAALRLDWGQASPKGTPEGAPGGAAEQAQRWLEVHARGDGTARMARDRDFAVTLHTAPAFGGAGDLDADVLTAWKASGQAGTGSVDAEDFFRAPRAAHTWSVIHLDGLLDRVPYPALWLSRAEYLLAPGGVLLASVAQLYPDLPRLAAQSSPLLADPQRVHLFSLSGLRRLARTFFPQVRCVPLPCGDQNRGTAGEDSTWLLVCGK